MTLVFAHRGAAAELPENTLPAFRRALELGADALETDVHLTADGAVVVLHDADGRRMAGVARRLADATLAEIQSWDVGSGFVNERGERPFAGQGYRIPTLEQLLVELAPARLNVDLKDDRPELVDRFIEIVRRHGAEARVIGASFHGAVLERLRAGGYRGETSLARWEFVGRWLAPRFLQRTRPAGARAQIPARVGFWPLDRRRIVDKLHALGLKVDFWTVNDPARARAIVALGADGVMTDDPRRIVPAVRAAGG